MLVVTLHICISPCILCSVTCLSSYHSAEESDSRLPILPADGEVDITVI